jgi:transposase-like protein
MMAKRGASLMQEAAAAELAAPALSFFSEIEEAEKRLAESGEFTGERLHRDRPGIYAAVVRMAAEGQSISATARALGVSRNTVCAVREREGISVEQERKELLKDLRKASRLGVEKVLELMPDLKSAKDAAITAAVMLDKMQLLSGEATSRVERVEVRPDQVKAFVDSLPVIEAELVEGEISTGVPGETSEQKAGALALPSPAPSSDLGSEVRTSDDREGQAGRATCRASRDAAAVDGAPGAGDGGGGGAASDAHAPGVIDTEKQNFGQRPNVRESGLGEPAADKPLCKRTPPKKKGSSKKAPTTAKKKGGSAC